MGTVLAIIFFSYPEEETTFGVIVLLPCQLAVNKHLH